eukprot:COSAG05_NODE_947_length_6480_cov_15.036671_4_plen_72_part_00
MFVKLRARATSVLSMMVTGGGGGARPASIHDANGRGPRVPSHASLRMHALTVHPGARRSIDMLALTALLCM